jgi:RNA recognition motif-containing protein
VFHSFISRDGATNVFVSNAVFPGNDTPRLTLCLWLQIRLLPPEAQEADLAELGARFGRVVSVRVLRVTSSSVEQDSRRFEQSRSQCQAHQNFDPSMPTMENRRIGTCRGVGFILFKKPDEAQRAVIGLNKLGFEASYARVSCRWRWSFEKAG